MKNLTLLFLLISSIVYSQKKTNPKLDFHPDITIAFITNSYFGDNYLAQGHQKQSVGFQIKSDWLHYDNFSLGFGVEKSTQKVTDFSLGGNIDKTNSNSAILFLSYKITLNSKLCISPEASYGGIELRQKSGGKFYGYQAGRRYGLGTNFNFELNKNAALYSNISYNYYQLNTRTTEEFIDYFNRSNAISVSLGIKFY